jgi:thiol-disulfide isomerase/thioredoxin
MSATMSKYMPNSVFAQGVEQRYLQAVQMNQQATPAPVQTGNLSIGSVAPELNFPGLDGKNISLHSLKGKVVLLDFWASWCGPCRKENPNVVKLYNEYKDKGFTIYSFSLDQDKNKWANAITKDGLIWPYHASDLKGWQSAGGAIYGVNSIPQTYLIGADGKIIAAGLRGIDLENKLKEILG